MLLTSHEQGKPFNRSGKDIRKTRSVRQRSNNRWFNGNDNSTSYNTVIFVPATPGSTLAKTLRDHEAANNQGRSSRIKVVEKSGMSVKQLLSKSYPWKTEKCSDPCCFPCSTNQKMQFSCRIPGASYRIVCTVCESSESSAVYYGETGQNLYSRGKQHLSEFRQKLPSNNIIIHNGKYHSDILSGFNFRMEGEALFTSTLNRQIDESLRIKYSEAEVVMNSGSEWRQDRIPRARVCQASRPI